VRPLAALPEGVQQLKQVAQAQQQAQRSAALSQCSTIAHVPHCSRAAAALSVDPSSGLLSQHTRVLQ
jgi:hypothetical protein